MIATTSQHDPVAVAHTISTKAIERWDAARELGKKTLPFARVALRAASFLARLATKQPQWRDPARALIQQISDHAQTEDDAAAQQGNIEHVWLGMLLTCATLTQRLDQMAERDHKRVAQPENARQDRGISPPSVQMAASVAPRQPPAAHRPPKKATAIPSDIGEHARWMVQQFAKQGKKRR